MDDTELAIARRQRQTEGLGLFDAVAPMTGTEAKREGMARALQPQELVRWREQFREAVTMWAERGVPFTSEDITDTIGLPRGIAQNKNNAVGAMMNGMAVRGIIRKTGRRVQSTRSHSHAREILEWVGVQR